MRRGSVARVRGSHPGAASLIPPFTRGRVVERGTSKIECDRTILSKRLGKAASLSGSRACADKQASDMDQQVTQAANTPGAFRHLVHIQPAVAVLTGLVTLGGAAFSVIRYFAPAADTGQIVAVIQEAKSGRALADATVEIRTPHDALVATLKPDSAGRLSYTLKEGTYDVRVSREGYATATNEVQVTPGHRVEIAVQMKTGSSLRGIGAAVKKIFR